MLLWDRVYSLALRLAENYLSNLTVGEAVGEAPSLDDRRGCLTFLYSYDNVTALGLCSTPTPMLYK